MSVDCAFTVLSSSQWHHSVLDNWGRRFPRDVGTVTKLGETAGRSPWLLFFCGANTDQKDGRRLLSFSSSSFTSSSITTCLSYLCCEKHFSKKISLMIQSLLHLPTLLFILRKQRCPVIITCPKEGKQLESNPVFVLHSLFWFWHFHALLPSPRVFSQHSVPATCL